MIISTERLLIRPFCIEHLNEFYNILQEDKILKYLPGVYSSNIEEVKENIEIYQNGDFINDFYFEIADKASQKIIGAIICIRTINNLYDVSYFIAKECRRQGYMYEALKSFLDMLKNKIPEANIHFYVKQKNLESISLLHKLGINLAYADKNCVKFLC